MFIILFFLGACVASFLNLCAYRIPRGFSIVYPQSSCEGCKSEINRLYLIPVIGYIISFGKCKKCGYKIPIIYPISEILFGVMVILLYLKIGFQISFIHNFILLSFLYLVSTIDFSTMEVHINIIIVFSLLLIATSLLKISFNESYLKDILIPLSSAFVFFLIFLIFGKLQWFGFGDSFVILVMTMFLSFSQGILSILLSFVLGGIVGILILLNKKSTVKRMPFCPFLCIGGVLSILFSENIIKFYLSLI